MDGLQTCGDDNACKMFVESVRGKKFLFALTISHTETCTIPGITIAGATPELAKYTPAADAEFLRYGRCKSIDDSCNSRWETNSGADYKSCTRNKYQR